MAGGKRRRYVGRPRTPSRIKHTQIVPIPACEAVERVAGDMLKYTSVSRARRHNRLSLTPAAEARLIELEEG